MTTFGTMRDRIDGELQRSGGLHTEIEREINSAIKHYESKRFRWNEVPGWTVAVTVAGTRYYSLTSDFIRFDTLLLKYNDAFIYMEPRTWDYIEYKDREITATRGIPGDYCIYAEQLRVWPVANDAYTLQGSYIRRLTTPDNELSVTSCTNAWLTFGEEMIRTRAKAAVQVNYLYNKGAITAMQQMAAQGHSFFSAQEQIAYKSLIGEQFDFQATGIMRPNFI